MLEKTFIVLLCLCSCFFTGLAENNVPPKSKWEIQVSDVQEEIYPAKNLCDGQMNTRWSSPAADPQFIWINLGRKCRISGFSLHWETAYSSAYSIALSNDKRDWEEIYSENSGDGKTDFIFFRPQVCQYIKFELKKRATGWGHSLWEIDIHGADNSFKVISPKLDDPSAILDNNPLSSISLTVPSDLIVDLGRMEKLSGARFDWGSEYARDMTLYASDNMHSWRKVAERENASGKFDYLLSAPFEARYLKLQVKKAIGKSKNVVLTNIKLRGAKESINNYVHCQLAAQKAPAGFYPEQLLGRQVYWTVVGSPDDSYESLLDEYGNFEAFAKTCTIMPYLFFDNRLHSALDANEILCELADNAYPMPSVHWRFPELSFTVSAMAWGKNRDTGSFLRYEIKNISSRIKKGTLFLAIRPFQINPIWQHGGLSHINSISCDNREKPSAVKVNNRINYYAISPPDQFGACAYERGDVIRFIQNEAVPAIQKISSSGPLASAVLAYKFKIAPGEIKNIYLAAPFHGKIEPVHNFIHTGADIDDAWKKHWNSTRLLWKNQISKTTLNIPDHDIANTVKSQLAYILLNRDGAAIQPGSRQYERSWIRDGAMTCAALLRWGLHDEVREFIVWY
ncbi:MAG: discoidin domain-containing protein, partial [Victivallales bacterium]|nr:discoidin domain-containing protein [Victivallales bacterium]